MRVVALFILGGCAAPTGTLLDSGATVASSSSSSSSSSPVVTCEDTPTAPTPTGECLGGGLPTDLVTVLTAHDADGNLCVDAGCSGDAVDVQVDVTNPCPVETTLDASCPPLSSWSVTGPVSNGSTTSCQTMAGSVWTVGAGESVAWTNLPLSGLDPGTYTIYVVPYGGPAAATLTFCLQP